MSSVTLLHTDMPQKHTHTEVKGLSLQIYKILPEVDCFLSSLLLPECFPSKSYHKSFIYIYIHL